MLIPLLKQILKFLLAFSKRFFTFLLVKFAELGTRLRNVERDNLQGLVAVNHALMAHMNQLSNADFVAKDFINTYEKATCRKRLRYTIHQYFILSISISIHSPVQSKWSRIVAPFEFPGDWYCNCAGLSKFSLHLRPVP